jgi:hypothetical protein
MAFIKIASFAYQQPPNGVALAARCGRGEGNDCLADCHKKLYPAVLSQSLLFMFISFHFMSRCSIDFQRLI